MALRPNRRATKPLPPRAPRALPREVRIIGGQWRGTRLPVADLPGLRPTPDRVRETLFNWLGQDLTGWRCLDAFAGTGALGLEAASRGAAEVLMVEEDAQLITKLRALKEKLHAEAVRIQQGDGASALRRCTPASLDLVFLDPPFEAHALLLAALAAAAKAVHANGWVYLEAPAKFEAVSLSEPGFELKRYLKAGAVHAHLLAARRGRTA